MPLARGNSGHAGAHADRCFCGQPIAPLPAAAPFLAGTSHNGAWLLR
jgi:hypothetical protein